MALLECRRKSTLSRYQRRPGTLFPRVVPRPWFLLIFQRSPGARVRINSRASENEKPEERKLQTEQIDWAKFPLCNSRSQWRTQRGGQGALQVTLKQEALLEEKKIEFYSLTKFF